MKSLKDLKARVRVGTVLTLTATSIANHRHLGAARTVGEVSSMGFALEDPAASDHRLSYCDWPKRRWLLFIGDHTFIIDDGHVSLTYEITKDAP